MTTANKYALILFISVVSIYFQSSYSIGSNSAIEDNDLGIVARECTAKFCKDKDSLEVWLSVEYYCVGQYMSEPLTANNDYDRKLSISSTTDISYTYSKGARALSGLFCLISGLFGLIVGFQYGRKIDKLSEFRYSQLPGDDITSYKDINSIDDDGLTPSVLNNKSNGVTGYYR